MVRVERTRGIDGAVDLQVSTVSELPDKGDVVSGSVIAAGSIAQIIQTGAFVTLDDNGNWYDESGSVVGG